MPLKKRLCKCGCETVIPLSQDNPFYKGHWNKNRKHTAEELKKISEKNIGKIPPNKGLTKDTCEYIKLGTEKMKKTKNENPRKWSDDERIKRALKQKETSAKSASTYKANNHTVWNKGLTKETDERVAKAIEKSTETLQSKSEFFRNLALEQWQKPGHRERISKSISGENHPFYRVTGLRPEDIDRVYPLEWTDTLKEAIRERDNRECQMCGMFESDNDVKLHVHHINYIKDDLELDNLITLCTACHGKTTINRKHWIKYFSSNLKLVVNN